VGQGLELVLEGILSKNIRRVVIPSELPSGSLPRRAALSQRVFWCDYFEGKATNRPERNQKIESPNSMGERAIFKAAMEPKSRRGVGMCVF
jgi:hypothetical protein